MQADIVAGMIGASWNKTNVCLGKHAFMYSSPAAAALITTLGPSCNVDVKMALNKTQIFSSLSILSLVFGLSRLRDDLSWRFQFSPSVVNFG